MLQPFRYWPDFCRHVGHPEWIDDERFDTVEKLMGNAAEAKELVLSVLATRTLAEWSETFKTLEGQWAPVQNSLELANDPQVQANGYVVDVDKGDGETLAKYKHVIVSARDPVDRVISAFNWRSPHACRQRKGQCTPPVAVEKFDGERGFYNCFPDVQHFVDAVTERSKPV